MAFKVLSKMRPNAHTFIEKFRVRKGPLASTPEHKNNGCFRISHKGMKFLVVVSDGGGWDHVSVSLSNRCPTWYEMCGFKEVFFEDEETVVQFHPKESEYVNCSKNCLHLWRKQDSEFELPPSIFVGPKMIEL